VTLNRRVLTIALLLFCLSLILFLINIQFPRSLDFDEFHYIPAAKQLLESNAVQNTEHPPLAKMLMSLGLLVFGDIPFGWRFMSAVFGAFTLVGMYFFGLTLFRDEKPALWAVLLTLVNNLLYVQSRIAMLDTYMFAFLIWAMVAFCTTWEKDLKVRTQRRRLAATGVFLGLAIACKWFGVVPWFSMIFLVAWIKLFQVWKVQFNDHHNKSHNTRSYKNDEWYLPLLWKDIRFGDWLMSLGVLPLATYSFVFFLYSLLTNQGFSLDWLVQSQINMWNAQQRVVSFHPYMSQWFQWPLLNRPIWYAFDREGLGQAFVRGVLLLGNPLVMWSGVLAILICLRDVILKRDRVAFLIAFFYCSFFLCWPFIPRRVTFYYYYYPSGMLLSLALAYAFFRDKNELSNRAKWVFLGVATLLFIYFFPLLAALKIPAESFRRWMWFQSWI